jgi:DNA helicase IV
LQVLCATQCPGVGRLSDDLDQEQRYVTTLYERLDGLRRTAADRLAQTLREDGSSHQARSQRDATAALYARTLAELDGVESGLCFGRLDFGEPNIEPRDPSEAPMYLGRIGIFADTAEHDPLLIDWRAPAARPFYLATAASPLGVRRRRHLRTRDRTVTGVDDEILDLSSADADAASDLTSETTLLAAVTASRTGQMRDIVATIQAEQDHIIRADMNGVLVVPGGPGTGKTAVALHRAAYLLYTYRQQLSTRGVLIVGPNRTFLRYISHVLPSLAETGVVLRTVGDLYPGVRATRSEPPEAAEVKGHPMMVDVLTQAVRDRQRVPEQAGMELLVEVGLGGKETLILQRADAEDARAAARRSGRPHNEARKIFTRYMLDALTRQLAEAIGTDPYADDPLGGDDAPGDSMLLGAADLADIRAELAAEPAVQEALDWLWPILTPQELLADLFADADAVASAAPALSPAERALLVRSPGGWTPADVPLLDEAAEVLGDTESADAARLEAERRRQEEYAQGALEVAEGSRTYEFEDEESEVLLVTDLLDAATLAERQHIVAQLTTAQRAAADRRWAFGHIIVDEAQELSPMAWRLLMRRCPSRSMTVVGDIAQTGDLAGAASWKSVFAPYVADRWRLAELTVNYRTPSEIMALAGIVLASIDPSLKPPASVRSTGSPPRTVTVDGSLVQTVASAVQSELAALGEGRLGVIVPAAHWDSVAAAVRSVAPAASFGADPDLTSPVAVLTVAQGKGLEFDSVIVVDPHGIETGSARGRSDLYVALTRATHRLTLVTPDA